MTDPSAISAKGRIIAFPAVTQQEKVPAVTITAASTLTVTAVNTESAFYRVKLDTGDEVALLTRRNPPKGLRIGTELRVSPKKVITK
ncbi:hypothetical protein [Herbaspirillum sp.]|uniref:hypothetical protein n=1 Tax=Herbaspirillum sp. TaxID=1890675 RepID=UPI0031DCFFBA